MNAPRQAIRSPEQVQLDLAVAGPTSRMLAYLIDYLVILILEVGAFILAISLPLGAILREFLSETGSSLLGQDAGAQASALLAFLAMLVMVQLVIEWGYFVVSEALTGGRSAGKLVVGLRVVRDGGLPLSLRESLARNLLRAVDILPGYYVTGLAAMVISREGKRLGDLAAGTVVVRLDRPLAAPPLRTARPQELERFRFDRAHLADLGSTELRLIRQTLRRFESLPEQQREQVLERTTGALITRMGYERVEPAQRETFLRALLEALAQR